MKTRVVEAKRKVCRRLLDGAARSAFVALLGLSAASYAQATTQPATQPAVSTLPAHWQELPVDKLTALAQQYQAMADSPAARADRQRLAQQSSPILQKSQSWEPSDRLGSMKLAAVVGSDFTADQRTAVLALIKEGILKPEVLAKLPADDFVVLDHSLVALGVHGADLASTAADWMRRSDQWKNASPEALLVLAGMLQLGDSPKAAVSQVSGQLWSAYLSQEPFFAQRDLETLIPLARQSEPLLTAEQRAQLETHIVGKFIQPPALAVMPPEQFSALYALMLDLGLRGNGISAMGIGWVNASEQWKKSSPDQLLNLMIMLGQGDPVPEKLPAEKKVAAFALTRMDSLVTTTTPLTVAGLAGLVGPFLESQQQAQVMELLNSHLVNDPKVLASLSSETVLTLWPALAKLGATSDQSAAVAVRWMNSGEQWKSSNPADLAILLGMLTNMKMDKQTAVVSSLFEEKAADAKLSGEDRARWLIQRANATENYTLGSKPCSGQPWLTRALALAESEPQRLQCIQRVALGDARLGHLDQAQSLIAGAGEKLTDAARQQLAALQPQLEQAAAEAKKNPVQPDQAVQWTDQSEFAAMMRQATEPKLSDEQRASLEKQIAGKYLQPAALASMPPDQFLTLFPAMLNLYWRKAQIASLAVGWTSASEQWKQSNADQFVQLMEMLRSDQTAVGAQAAEAKVGDYVAMQIKGGAASVSASPLSVIELASSVGPFLESHQKAQLNQSLTDRFVNDSKAVGTLPSGSLLGLWIALGSTGSTPEQCVAVVSKWMQEGDQWKSSNPGDLAALLAMLTHAKPGKESATVAALFEERSGDKTLSADERATWLLARADAAAMGSETGNLLSGEPWISKALALADSEFLRLECVRRLALGNAIVGHADRARALLASVNQQFSDDGRQKLGVVQKQVDQAAAAVQKDEAAQQAAARTAWKQELQTRLDMAKAKNDQAQITRYQSLLAQQ